MRPAKTTLRVLLVLLSALVAAVLTGCTSPSTDTVVAPVTGANGQKLNLTAQQDRIVPAKDDQIAALVPPEIRARGTLIIGQGSGAGNPPFSFPSSNDDKEWIGDEVDIATLVAGVLGLKPEFKRSSWEGLFLGIDSGATDVGFSNITVTEARKDIYDFASYRSDILSLITNKDSTLKLNSYEDLSGKRIAVGSGTNQEKILVGWSDKLAAEGKPKIDIVNFQETSGVWTALSADRFDGYFGPNPINAFHDAQVKGTPQETKLVGEFSGAGNDLTGLIAAATKKGNPLITAVHAALDKLTHGEDYKKVLERWNLSREAVTESQLNPPGLPRS